MEVSIIQEDCTGCSACPDYADVFFMHDDGIAYVKEAGTPVDLSVSPKIEGFLGKVAVPEKDIDEVIAAAEQCPGMCIYVHVVAQAEMTASS